ncbi:MAG: tRNA 4-thiouridine(8) synthase ThiI [Candidatus Omnitrophica bacterium]|nr:tRNA 4-thiouridine(8) synthase ThiI [Candidatus Omnitrophota bacterium]
MTKAIVLISGGLDSILAAKVLMGQGIDLIGVTYVTEFLSTDLERYRKHIDTVTAAIGLNNRIIDISAEYLALLNAPLHGFGANINPCIDCKIYMLKRAKDLMKEEKAAFIVTGEVLGERPMSQRRDALNIIERESGLKGYLLRPLSAKLLPETVPELEKIVDRERLYDIRGRSRKPQMALAEQLGIKQYSQPGGGCLLTDPGFTARLEDLIGHGPLTLDDARLLKCGRHFRLDGSTKFVLGRDQDDNERLLGIARDNDIILAPDGFPGPIGILRGEATAANLTLAARVLVGHTKKRADNSVGVRYSRRHDRDRACLRVSALTRDKIDAARVGAR